MSRFITPARRTLLRPLAQTFVPETGRATPAQWEQLEATIERGLEDRSRRDRRRLALFLRVVELLAWMRYGASLPRLDPARRNALLLALSRSPLLLLRRGVWGLRTLVMMGWYTQPDVALELGYRASPAGWSARR